MGYRAALAPIFKLAGSDYMGTVELDLLFKALRKGAPKGGVRAPHWDFALGLQCGPPLPQVPPFEPISSLHLEVPLMKALFLTALATAHRVGELQALSSSVGFGRDGSALLSFSPTFLA